MKQKKAAATFMWSKKGSGVSPSQACSWRSKQENDFVKTEPIMMDEVAGRGGEPSNNKPKANICKSNDEWYSAQEDEVGKLEDGVMYRAPSRRQETTTSLTAVTVPIKTRITREAAAQCRAAGIIQRTATLQVVRYKMRQVE